MLIALYLLDLTISFHFYIPIPIFYRHIVVLIKPKTSTTLKLIAKYAFKFIKETDTSKCRLAQRNYQGIFPINEKYVGSIGSTFSS